MDKVQTLKGFRDFLPAEAKKRQFVINTLKSVFSLYGFDPLETPTLEYEEVLMGKYGDEGDKLLYRFTDNGDRRVAMRYDQTVPLARVIAQYANDLPFPFKRYQIQPVWRAENTQKGRFREFLQCDIDTAGTGSAASDAEIVTVVAKSLEALGLKKYRILINDRSIFGDLPASAIIIIDKLKKIGEEGVKKELQEKGFDPSTLERIKNTSPTESLTTIINTAKNMGVTEERIVFEPTLARGLDYYTGMILEVEIEGYTAGSVVGGGRYDNLIGMFTNRQVPAVGVAFGFDRILDAMDENNLFPETLTGSTVLVSVFNTELGDASLEVASRLRAENITTELWLDASSKMDKQLKYANQKQIPYVIVLGPEEKEKNVVTLKNMKTREQKEITLEEAITQLSA